MQGRDPNPEAVDRECDTRLAVPRYGGGAVKQPFVDYSPRGTVSCRSVAIFLSINYLDTLHHLVNVQRHVYISYYGVCNRYPVATLINSPLD